MRLKTAFVVGSVVAMITSAACATPGRHTLGEPEDTLTAQQMIDANAVTLYEGVLKLRPRWFNSRGPRSVTDQTPTIANVVVGGQVVGDIEYLRNLRPEDVAYLRYYDVGEAGVRFGMNNPRGVIEIVFMKGGGGS